MTHTPTPWRYTDDGKATTVRADNGTYPKPIAEIWDNGDSREDNAAFIVKAVNAYDLLTAQNEWLKDRLANLQLPANSQLNIEGWLVECGMPTAATEISA